MNTALWHLMREGQNRRNCFLVDNAPVIRISSPQNVVCFGVIAYTGPKWTWHVQGADFPNQQILMHTQQRCHQLHTQNSKPWRTRPQVPLTVSGWQVLCGSSQLTSACCGLVFPSINRNLCVLIFTGLGMKLN